MGAGISYTRNVSLAQYIHRLQSPEDALLDELVLELVDCDFVNQESEVDEQNKEDELIESKTLLIDEDDDDTDTMVTDLCGRRNNMVPFTYTALVYRRRLQVLYHVIHELDSRRNDVKDAFFASNNSVPTESSDLGLLESSSDASIDILSAVCASSLEELSRVDAAVNVIHSLKDVLMSQFDAMRISSLQSPSLDLLMEFLVGNFDATGQADALESLCILGCGRGSVQFLLKLAVRLLLSSEESESMKQILQQLAEKTIAYDSTIKAKSQMAALKDISKSKTRVGKMVSKVFKVSYDECELTEVDNNKAAPVSDIWRAPVLGDSGIQCTGQFQMSALFPALQQRVIQISGSENHLVLVTARFEAFALGDNSQGQCGVGQHIKLLEVLTQVKIDLQVHFVSSGSNHTLFCVDGCSNLFTTGSNSHGQLGCDIETTNRYVPASVEFFASKHISAVGAGSCHSAVLFETSEVFGFGKIQGRVTTEPISMETHGACTVAIASYEDRCFVLEKGDSSFTLSVGFAEEEASLKWETILDIPGMAAQIVAGAETIHILTIERTPFEEWDQVEDQFQIQSDSSVGLVMSCLEIFPVRGNDQVSELLLSLLKSLKDQPQLVICALKLLQRHCFVSSSLVQHDMSSLKDFLFELAKSSCDSVKEEAIRTIGNGFAYLSPSAAELAAFLATITNMTYLQRFATLKFWSELLGQNHQDMAMTLIERLIELNRDDSVEVLSLLLAMHRSVLLSPIVHQEFVNSYMCTLCQWCVENFKSPEEWNSSAKTLMQNSIIMLSHEKFNLSPNTTESLIKLLNTLESFDDTMWLEKLRWDILMLVLVKEVGDTPQHIVLGKVSGLLSGGFCSKNVLEERLVQFEQVVVDSGHSVMAKVSKMNLLKFKKKPGEEQVWLALRAVYAVLTVFDKNGDNEQSCQRILRWINEVKQSAGVSYSEIGAQVVARCKFILEFESIGAHSAMSFVQVYDESELLVCQAELKKQIEMDNHQARAFQVMKMLIVGKSLSPDRLRHSIFCLCALLKDYRVKDMSEISHVITTLLQCSSINTNPVLKAAVIDLLYETEVSLGALEFLTQTMDFDQCAVLEEELACGHLDTYNNSNSLTSTFAQATFPFTCGIQWSRAFKYSGLQLSKNGLCVNLPYHGSAYQCSSAAAVSLSHSLYSGRFYLQIQNSVTPPASMASLVYAVGLGDPKLTELDGFSKLLCSTFSVEQDLGLFIDMDVGHFKVFRHNDLCYKNGGSCALNPNDLFMFRKFNIKLSPLRPVLVLLTPGTTAFLKQVVVQSENTRIFIEEPSSIVHSLSTTPHSPSITPPMFPPRNSVSSTSFSHSLPNDTEEVVEPNQNPEQQEHAEERKLLIAGPLGLNIAEETELLVCGQNSYGELGLKDQRPHKDVLVCLHTKGMFAIQVVAGNEVTAVLTTQGEVYTWGYNAKGTCASGLVDSNDDAKKEMVESPSRVKIPQFVTHISCGNGSEHMFAITASGQLFGWGFNQYGQLGLGHKFDKIFFPNRVEGALKDKRVVAVCNSYSHSLALTSDGEMYGFGLNTRGQLGIGSTADLWTLPQRLTHLSGRVKSMACGVEHSAIVMQDGSLYTFGRNDVGQLGIDDPSISLSAIPVRVADGLSKLRSLSCETVSCGYYFTVVIADGRLHSFGKNDLGQLGVGHNQDMSVPVPVMWSDENDRFVAVSSGTGHSLAVTSYGRVISWGRNKDGGLGNGTTMDNPYPKEICCKGDMSLSLRDQRPIHIAAGFHHSCILVGKVRNVDASTGLSWGIRAAKASWLLFQKMMEHHVNDGTLGTALVWLTKGLQRSFQKTSCTKNGPLNISTERRDLNHVNWIEWIVKTGANDSGLYTSQILQLLYVLIKSQPGKVSKMMDTVGLVALLFDIGFASNYPLRSSVAFDILSILLPHVPIQQLSPKYSLRKMLLYAGVNSNLVVGSLVVSLLRTLLLTDSKWRPFINRGLLHNLAYEIPRLSEDVEDLCILHSRKEAFNLMMGSLAVLGGSLEVLYTGCRVSVVANEVEGQEGILDWYTPLGGHSEIAQVSFPSSPPMLIRKHQELFPLTKTKVPVDCIEKPDRLLALLVNLVQQSVSSRAGTTGLDNVIAARLHETSKARAGQVVHTLLHDQPMIVQAFVSNGHLQAVTSLLAAPRGRLDELSLRELHHRFLCLEMLQRSLEGPPVYDESSSPDDKKWSCSACGFTNTTVSKSCEMCYVKQSAGDDIEKSIVESHSDRKAAITKKLSGGTPEDSFHLNHTDQIACTWNFEGGIKPDNKRVQASLKKLSENPKESDNADDCKFLDEDVLEKYLTVPCDSYLSLGHFFSGNGSAQAVYLNQYTLIIDIRIPASSLENDFTSILQTGVENDSLADWYVRSSGSVGCIQYSKPGLVTADTWTRLAMSADLSKGEVSYYVDGELAVTLTHDGSSTIILEDDRWCIDTSLCLFRDVDPADAGEVCVSQVQLRSYAMLSHEVALLGKPIEELPMPTVYELAERLSKDLKLPRAWCVRSLQATNHRLLQAREWLRANEQALIVRTVSEARMLTALGYTRMQCAQAICTTGSLADAIRLLLDNDVVENYDLNISRIMQECAKDDSHFMRSTDVLAINLSDDDQDAYNKTYEIYDNVASVSDVQSITRNSVRSLPALGAGMRQVNAELWETARQLFITFARQATVSILENSLIVRSSSVHDNDLIRDMQHKLLAVDGTGRNFLRNYLRAFPDSIRKDIRSGTMTSEIERGDPIQVLRRKLLLVFPQEVSKQNVVGVSSLTEGLKAWTQYRKNTDTISIGKQVWWMANNVMVQGTVRSSSDEVIKQRENDFQQLARVLFDFEPQRKGDLPLKKGASIIVLGATKSGWGRAKDVATGNVGTIPLNLVDAIGEEFDSIRPSSPAQRPLNEHFEIEDNLTKEIVTLSCNRLVLEQPPTHSNDPRIKEALLEQVDDELWKHSVLRTLSEDILQELVLLARGPWQFLPGGLQAGPSVDFLEIWNDKLTSISQVVDRFSKKTKEVVNERPATIRIWRPFADSGYCILGDVVTTGADERPEPVTVVSDDDGMGGKTCTSQGHSLLARPMRFKLVWQIGKEHSDEQVSFWEPIPPEGYVALGCVAVKGLSRKEPDVRKEQLQHFRCVHETCVQVSTLHRGLWTYRLEESERSRTKSDASDDDKKKSKYRMAKTGVSVWEIDNSSRTFSPVIADDPTKDQSKLLSVNRVDAASIESRLTIESERKTSDDDAKARMLHGLKLTSTSSSALGKPSVEGMIRPFHLGLASTTDSNHGSSELLLWILQLLSEFDANETNGMGRWARRVFSPQLVHALLRFSRNAAPAVRIKAIRMLAMVIRRTPPDTIQGKLKEELLELRVQMESLYKRQAQKSKDGHLDEMPLFSSLLCALAEVFVAVSLQHSDMDSTSTIEDVLDEKVAPISLPVEMEIDSTPHQYIEVTFAGPLGIEILSNKDVLVVHSVKDDGCAFSSGVMAYDIFWEMNNKKVSEYEVKELWDTIKTKRPLNVTFLRDKSVTRNLHLQDDELQLPVETPVSLNSQENWFQQLSELAAIMEALVRRESVKLPSEFLMAEDTFLKLVLAHHTAVVESPHPYSGKVVQGEVSIPGAEALVLRFDRRCSTPFGKTLVLACNVKVQKIEKRLQVETLQGCFGGCSVHVPASVLHYTFPVPQSMNWSLHRTADYKAPEVRVSNNGKTASLRKDKVWQTVFSTTGFSSGINTWEVRVDRTGPSANIFFGVAMKSAKVANYLGCDEKGWGWIGCMACWHGGRKVRFKFGKRLKSGDIVRVTLDIPRRAMSIACNGEDWGVAFNKLPLPSTLMKPGNELVPTFSFYNKDDQITLLSGSSSVDPETAAVLHQLRSNFEQQHATARITQQFGSDEQSQQNATESRQENRVSRRSIARSLTTRVSRRRDDEGSQQATSQPDEQALMLSALGYPVEWCVQALHAMENDVNRAAEYLITHADRMAEESKQEEHRAAVEDEEQVIAEEEEWLAEVNSRLDHEQDIQTTPITAADAAVAALQTASMQRIVQKERVIRPTSDLEDTAERKQTSKRDKNSFATKEWGYRMTISPLFSRETTKRIAQEPKNMKRLQTFHALFEKFTLEHDCELVRLVNEICAKVGEDPLTFSPNDLEPTDDELENYKSLIGIPQLHLQLRFLVLRNFNRRLAHVLPLVDLSCAAHESALAASLRSVRGLVMSSVKKALFERVLNDSHSGDDHWMQQNKLPTVTLDRNKAADFLKSGRVDTRGARTVFGQLFAQLHGSDYDKSDKNPLLVPTAAVQDASLLRNSHRAWYTILAGERADDYGGPYRDVFNQACQELLTPALPLFVPCPNQVVNQGENRGKYLPLASSSSYTALAMYEFVGKLMGISMRTKNPFVLDLPSFVWKQLCNDHVSMADIRSCDLDFYQTFKGISSLGDEELKAMDLRFTMKGSDGRAVEIIPGGNSTMVTLNRRDDYCAALEKARLHELDRQCTAIARGLGTQVPRNLLSLFTADELELMVCGPPEVDIAILKANTVYGDGISDSTPSVELFWQVLEEFSQDDKQKYLRFVWGRSRLPSSTADWERKHKINKYTKVPADNYMPIGHTCFFTVDIPMYSSLQVCREKLLYAVTHCIAIDADETTVARQAAEGGEWLNRNQDDDDDDDDDDGF